jgi:hypothetical protein
VSPFDLNNRRHTHSLVWSHPFLNCPKGRELLTKMNEQGNALSNNSRTEFWI